GKKFQKFDVIVVLNVYVPPFGKVHTLEVGDLSLFESRAINRYLARKHKETGIDLLLCDDDEKCAIVDAWQEVEAQQFNHPLTAIFSQIFVHPMREYTLADHHIPGLVYFMRTSMAFWITSRPHVNAWWKDISSSPASIKTNPVNKQVNGVAGLGSFPSTFHSKMAVRKVYGTLWSTETLRVIASLHEHELDFEFIPVDVVSGDLQREPLLSLNPFGEVPVFQDGDLILIESRAAMRYMAFEYPAPGKEHVFKDPLLQGIVAGWIDIEDHQFDPPAFKLINELVLQPKRGMKPDQAIVTDAETKLGCVLDIYEERLTKLKYLAGDVFTSADLTHVPDLYFLKGSPAKALIESRPHVKTWCEEIMARPTWTKVQELMAKA
ncbi:Glutathione S-transferase, C-terminal, partial [Dillenia turbinata]